LSLLSNKEFLIWKERGVGGLGGQQAGRFKVRICLGEIEGINRYREIERHRHKETELTKILSKAG
jgi:hypothetical protein